ncbi:hypothetical protein E4T56_gene2943 [Termitomyces sp. T112]|nr:hypothetical protein E4T56_gene2943 [Termitomyces sp. T112]
MAKERCKTTLNSLSPNIFPIRPDWPHIPTQNRKANDRRTAVDRAPSTNQLRLSFSDDYGLFHGARLMCSTALNSFKSWPLQRTGSEYYVQRSHILILSHTQCPLNLPEVATVVPSSSPSIRAQPCLISYASAPSAGNKTLKVEGKEHLSVYKAVMNRGTPDEYIATSERNFCSKCSSMLWLYDEMWPEFIHPFASAIDSPDLKVPNKLTVIKLDSKPAYVRLPERPREVYDDYGKYSLEEWHKKHRQYVE